MIDIQNISIGFGNQLVLENIDLKIPKNEITVIVGRSGCGKSVLMKTIEGLIVPRTGKILIDGTNVFDLNKNELFNLRKKISMVFQASALLDSLNVFQNIALPLVEHSKLSDTEIEVRVLDKLSQLGLKGAEKKMPAELSGGMKKRVALARALILKPDYIIYDEPTTGLDPIIAEEIIELILKLQNTFNLTSIIITHDLNCVNNLKGHLVLLEDKEIIFDGNYSDVSNVNNDFMNKFLGKK